ncbi:isochorismate synthase MenF [Vibrio sp. SS-MA-C1-2]|uniref:isochorismate synthase n=1 Tax=Vibrio sp. SS-MA-C1-2 TaxID=2908646 RepID=UPI0038FC3D28
MIALSNAINAIIEELKLAEELPSRITASLKKSGDVDPIDWLADQTLFPKFYWQSRDGEEETIALGQVEIFNDIRYAEFVVDEGQFVWGGCSFDCQMASNQHPLKSFFCLPRIELKRQNDEWTLSVNLQHDLQRVLLELEQLKTTFVPLAELECDIINQRYSPDFLGWKKMVDKALSEIDKGEFVKVVLARKTTLTLEKAISATQLLKASREANQNSFHFLVSFDQHHGFIGSTPERLFRRDQRKIKTEALAGTTGRGDTIEEDNKLADWLLHDQKNCYENRLVVEDILNRLSNDCVSVTPSDETELYQLRKVQHLKRPINAELNLAAKDSDVLQKLQPTAAIAGLPRSAALNFITKNEPFSRGWYSGAIGMIGKENSEFCVAIRSAVIESDELHLFAGAGIVPGSEAESEWQELNKKTATLYSLLKNNLM